MTAVNLNWHDVLSAAGWKVHQVRRYGPAGASCLITAPVNRAGSLIISESDYPDSDDWIIHASLAFETADPEYADLALIHRAVFGRKRWSYQVFAPESDHVNIHPHALHLWGRVDGKPMLPNFGQGGTI